MICIRVSQIQSYLPYSPPSFSSSFSLSHSRTHTARLFLLEMPGGLGSAIWSPPSAEETFAGSECSFPPSFLRAPGRGAELRGGRLEELLCAGQPLFRLQSQGSGQECTNGGRVPQPQIHPLSSVFSPRFSCLFTSHDFLLPSGVLGGWRTRRKTGMGVEGRGPRARALRGEEEKKVLAPWTESGPSAPSPYSLSGTVQNSSHQLLPI